jgi:cell division protein FtsW
MATGPTASVRPSSPPGGRPQLRLVRGATPRGRRADRTVLLVLVGALSAIGLVLVLAASAYTSLVDYGSVWSIFLRQVIWVGLGTLALVVCAAVPYRAWRRWRTLILVGGLALLVLVLVPGIGEHVAGSTRWLGFGQLRVQPSELMKLALCVFAADLATRRAHRATEPRALALPLLAITGAAAFLVLLQPDLGTAIVLAAIAFAVLLVAGVPGKVLAGAGIAGVLLTGVAALAEPYRRARLLSFIDPLAHRETTGYQVVQSLVGISSGGPFGLGLGNGQVQWGLLPNPHTDFIFSVLGQDTGVIGVLVVSVLFVGLAVVGLRIAGRAPDRFGALLALAVTCWISVEALINMGAVVGLLPVTGIPLPFISFGGSSTVVVMAGIGMLANVARASEAHQRRPRRGRAGSAGARSSGAHSRGTSPGGARPARWPMREAAGR